jgi:uncharacterized coiled-coil protein SlyX
MSKQEEGMPQVNEAVPEQLRIKAPKSSSPTPSIRWLTLLAVLLACATAISLGYMLREQEHANQLSSLNQQMSSRLLQMREQLDTLTSKLNDLSTQRAASAATASQAGALPPGLSRETQSGQRVAKRANVTRRRAEDPRWKKVQAQLDDQQRQIASTRDDLQKARTDLEANLSSSHDELNGSIAANHGEIAKTHDELVVLEKRGERSYFEFDLSKAKQFQHIGPLGLCLRKTNVKHARYNLEVLLDDNEISKKDLNLYEAVAFYPERSQPPLELVVNHIGKGSVHGYISTPKYKESELASSPSRVSNGAAPSVSSEIQTERKDTKQEPSSNDQSLPHRPGGLF